MRAYIEVPCAWIECIYDVDVGPLTHRCPGYETQRWIVLHEGWELPSSQLGGRFLGHDTINTRHSSVDPGRPYEPPGTPAHPVL